MCECVWVSVCMYVCVWVCVNVWVCVGECVYVCECVRLRVCVCECVWEYVRVFECVCSCVCVWRYQRMIAFKIRNESTDRDFTFPNQKVSVLTPYTLVHVCYCRWRHTAEQHNRHTQSVRSQHSDQSPRRRPQTDLREPGSWRRLQNPFTHILDPRAEAFFSDTAPLRLPTLNASNSQQSPPRTNTRGQNYLSRSHLMLSTHEKGNDLGSVDAGWGQTITYLWPEKKIENKLGCNAVVSFACELYCYLCCVVTAMNQTSGNASNLTPNK
jgi:hypothetical protein